MSQASKAIKELAAAGEYTALSEALKNSDYEAVASNYGKLSILIEEKKNSILGQIDNSPLNVEENRQNFITAFSLRLATALPDWHRLNSLISEQNIIETDVIDVGSKGDPIVKSPEGKTVIINGTKAEKGTRIKYKITNQSPKVDFGIFIEMNGNFFYNILNQQPLAAINQSLNSVEIKVREGVEHLDPESLTELLSILEETKKKTAGLNTSDEERINRSILTYRKNLLYGYANKVASDFIAGEEIREIKAIYNNEEEKSDRALRAPGLFRSESIRALSRELFTGNSLNGYDELLKGMENDIDSMDRALKLMEFKAKIEELKPQAVTFLGKMDELFSRLNNKIKYITNAIAEDNIVDINNIKSRIESEFSGPNMLSEITVIFRNPGEYFTLRDAAAKLKEALGDNLIISAESAIRPYLKQKLNNAFEQTPARK